MSAIYQSRVAGGGVGTANGMAGPSQVQERSEQVARVPAAHLGGRERERNGNEVPSSRPVAAEPAGPVEEGLPPPKYTSTPEPGHTVVA